MKNDQDEMCIEFGPPLRLGAVIFSCLGIYLLLQSGWKVVMIEQRGLPFFTWPVIIIIFLFMLATLWRNIFFRERLVVQRLLYDGHRRSTIIQCADIIDVSVELPPLYQTMRWAVDWFGFGNGLLVIHTNHDQLIFGPGAGYKKALVYQAQILAFCNADNQDRRQVKL